MVLALGKEFVFSKHYKEDKKIDKGLAKDCIQTGKKFLDGESNKFKSMKKYRKGDLIVIYREYVDYFFVITAFWNVRGVKNEF